jgi:hypothetical protein
MAKSPRKSSPRKSSPRKSPRKSPARSPGGKVKFFDLVLKKPFYTSSYETIVKKTDSKNGKRKVTYLVTDNPTKAKSGKSFKNWKILKNEKA